MRTFDLSPLYRSTVGFDRLFSMLDGFEAAPGYPPYNIERTGENDYRVTVAVAGFGENDLSIEAKENTLTIKGGKQAKEEQNGEVLYQGIAARAFERVFQLADHVQVKNASLENGLLHVDLVREIPEAKKPRQIPIGNGNAKAQVNRDEGCGLTFRSICKDGSAPAKPGRFRLRRSPVLGLATLWHGAIAATALRGIRVRGPVLAWFSRACARMRKVLANLAWTSLVRRGKIWHGPLGQ